MSDCIYSSGYTLTCKNVISGVKDVWLGNWNSGITVTINSDDVVTAIANPGTWYNLKPWMESAEFITEGEHAENGTNRYNSTLSMEFRKYDGKLMALLTRISDSNISAIVQDQNSLFWILGVRSAPGDVNASTLGVGKAFSDLHGGSFSIIFKGAEPENEITEAAKDT